MENTKTTYLKFQLVNGYGVLVDQEAEIKEGEWAIEMYNGQSQAVNPLKFTDENGNNWFVRKMNMYCGKNDQEAHKIIFSEKELGLEGVPVFEWRDFEVEKLAIKEFPHDTGMSIVARGAFRKGYKSNPAKYTEEDLRKAMDMMAQGSIVDDEYYPLFTEDEIIQSLQKYPKYVVMDSENYCGSPYTTERCPKCVDSCDRAYIRPKLFTNSYGKQQGTIKEIIWES
jgi:hypothetical protein